jgi:pyruvate dehydrogenase E2 component (dihydrolipoamide acetyltransferase)
MPVKFKMPDPGEGIHEAEILEILVAEGDRVEEDQPLMRIETDKADVELPSPVSGTVKQILVSDGDVVEVGDVLVVILEEGEDQDGEQAKEDKADDLASAEKEQQAGNEEERKKQERKSEDAKDNGEEPKKEKTRGKKASEKKESKPEEKSATEAQKSKSREEAPRKGPVPATPATRRLARELDVALDQVEPSGPGGRVTPEDVKAQAEGDQKKSQKEKETPAAVKPAETEGPELPDFSQWGEVERTPLRSIRRATAKRMALAWSEIPHVTHEDLADITELEKFRQDNKDDIDNQGGALTLTVFAIKAAVAALKAYPRFNASLDIEAGEIISKKYFHIGVAVDTDRGLLVPVVRDADCKSMVELAREVTELAERTRRGEVEPRDMSGGTFTITNVGPLGGTGFTPIINFPQVAILGLAKARLQPMIRGDINDFDVVPRLMLPLVLGFDHRIVDGADAARFLGEVIRLLESPQNLMLSQ